MPTEDEFKTNRDHDDWQLVRAAIEHENTLVNYRLTWFCMLQGFLFTAFGVILDAWTKPEKSEHFFLFFSFLSIISILSISICWVIWRTLRLAEIQIKNLDWWWHSEKGDKFKLKNNTREIVNESYSNDDFPNKDLFLKKLSKYPPLQVDQSFYPSHCHWYDRINSYHIPFIFMWILVCIFIVLLFFAILGMISAREVHSMTSGL